MTPKCLKQKCASIANSRGRNQCSQSVTCFLTSTALPVTFKREIQRLVVKEGDSGIFCCELSKPGAGVEWKKGRVVIKPGGKYEMKQEGCLTKLVINHTEESDGGKYTCKTNGSQCTAELIVQGETGFQLSSLILPKTFAVLHSTRFHIFPGRWQVCHPVSGCHSSARR